MKHQRNRVRIAGFTADSESWLNHGFCDSGVVYHGDAAMLGAAAMMTNLHGQHCHGKVCRATIAAQHNAWALAASSLETQRPDSGKMACGSEDKLAVEACHTQACYNSEL